MVRPCSGSGSLTWREEGRGGPIASAMGTSSALTRSQCRQGTESVWPAPGLHVQFTASVSGERVSPGALRVTEGPARGGPPSVLPHILWVAQRVGACREEFTMTCAFRKRVLEETQHTVREQRSRPHPSAPVPERADAPRPRQGRHGSADPRTQGGWGAKPLESLRRQSGLPVRACCPPARCPGPRAQPRTSGQDSGSADQSPPRGSAQPLTKFMRME